MPEVSPSKYYVTAGWDSVPHIDAKTKREVEASTPPHLRAARMRGEPSLGAGAVYPIDPDHFRIPPIPIPEYFTRGYGMDVGWNRTAAIWGAHDRDNDVLYVIGEHYVGQQPPAVHAAAIAARGAWQTGFIDPASQGSSQVDGKKLIEEYRRLGLKLTPADNAVEAGVAEVYQRLSSGRLKVFSTLTHFFDEYRLYRRKDSPESPGQHGKIVKEHDHCLHPDTLVHTDNGRVPIRHLVGTTGKVVSSDGRLHQYRSCRMTAADQQIVEVNFSDGSSVKCTPDHKFLTTEGWMEAMDLVGALCYSAVSQGVHKEDPCKSTSYQTRSKSLLDCGIGDVGNISSATAVAFTSLCGPQRTAPRLPRAITSITGTKTARTISQTISSLSTAAATCRTITRASVERLRRALMSKLPNGMAPKLALNGIGSISSGTGGQNCTFSASSPASNAGRSSSLKTTATTASARTVAKRAIASCPESMTSPDPASFARPNSWSTDIVSEQRAAQLVTVRCLGIRDAGRSDVYCLTVPATAAFAVEGGTIVHNCLDCLRYLAMGVRQMKMRPVEGPLGTHAPLRNTPLDRRAGY